MYVSAAEKSGDATTNAHSTRLPYLLMLSLLLKLPTPSLLQAVLQDWAVPLLQLLQLSLAVPFAQPPGFLPPGFACCADASELVQTHERPSLSAHLQVSCRGHQGMRQHISDTGTGLRTCRNFVWMIMTWREDHHRAKKCASIYNQLLCMPCVWSNAGMTFKHNYTSTVLI